MTRRSFHYSFLTSLVAGVAACALTWSALYGSALAHTVSAPSGAPRIGGPCADRLIAAHEAAGMSHGEAVLVAMFKIGAGTAPQPASREDEDCARTQADLMTAPKGAVMSPGEAVLVAMFKMAAGTAPEPASCENEDCARAQDGSMATGGTIGQGFGGDAETSNRAPQDGLRTASFNGPFLAAKKEAPSVHGPVLHFKDPNGPRAEPGEQMPQRAGPLAGLAKFISEVAIDATVQDPGRGYRDSNTVALGGEILLRELYVFETGSTVADFILSPRPFVGLVGNLQNGPNGVYFGLDWTGRHASGIFAGVSFGGIVHDGVLRNANPKTSELGSRFLFRQHAQLGYRFENGHGISAYAAHASNGNLLARQNQGLNWVGLRYSYALIPDHRFGR